MNWYIVQAYSGFEKKVADDYNLRFHKYGAHPKSSLWFSEQRQLLRFDLIIQCIKNSPAPSYFNLNDIGCGYGEQDFFLNNKLKVL